MDNRNALTLGALAAVASVAMLSVAQADVTVTVWGGFGQSPIAGVSPDQAENPIPAATPDATFTAVGIEPIDWVNNEANNGTSSTGNLYGSFFNNIEASSFSSPSGAYSSLASFLDTSMSSEGNTWYTYIEVTGFTEAVTNGYVNHDDGASLYSVTCAGGVCFSSPGQTSQIQNTFTIGAGAFQLDYIEANGSPSVLEANLAVPETSTWAMMLVGFAGVGFLGYRRSRNTALATG